ncbi:hypothetical protein GKZ89_16255 [Bacillus mangrovi]|uniref:Uncharacterized protein n=1 Tax=Metabacillus mangrovi TaxID=1491830 RepID=A0A7X2S854_9BACI|nr:hypothetical protein [Metabacillus mangrovi]MTH54956.1 hypothetical protein [Metabacillus mangrovi]
MFTGGFEKITPINGFSPDVADARQNDYAWAVSELGDYLYVGTGRNIPNLAFEGVGLPIPKAFLPNNDYRAEIWRIRKDGTSDWEFDFKTAETSFGFRFMIQYPLGAPDAKLYTAATSPDGSLAVIYRRTEDVNWVAFAGLEGGTSRSMEEHLGRLYVATVPLTTAQEIPKLFVLDETGNNFARITLPAEITGEITVMQSFNGQLYIGLSKQGGLDVWRTVDGDPSGEWQLVVDQGAGDAINFVAFDMTIFDDAIYLGTGMVPFLPLLNGTPVITKGFDIVRIDADDTWRIIVGGKPDVPTEPVTGNRNLGLYPSGFGNPFNAYCWQIQRYDGEIYAGSFDWTVVIPPGLMSIFEAIFGSPDMALLMGEEMMEEMVMSFLTSKELIPNPFFGFDLWKSGNAVLWTPITFNGLGNPKNYGVRNLFPSDNGNLYLGTANPFQGCEVWVKEGGNSEAPAGDAELREVMDGFKDSLRNLQRFFGSR